DRPGDPGFVAGPRTGGFAEAGRADQRHLACGAGRDRPEVFFCRTTRAPGGDAGAVCPGVDLVAGTLEHSQHLGFPPRKRSTRGHTDSAWAIHLPTKPRRNPAKSSASGESGLARLQIRYKPTVTTGLTSRLMTTRRLRQAARPKDGMMAMPSSASTMAICVSNKLIEAFTRLLMPAAASCLKTV